MINIISNIYIYSISLYIILILLDILITRLNKYNKGIYKDISTLHIFECGFNSYFNILSIKKWNRRYFIRYYIICIIYLIFDIEVIFIYPLGLCLDELLNNNISKEIIWLLSLIFGYLLIGIIIEINGI